MKTSKSSSERAEKFWICEYKFERIHGNGDFDTIRDKCLIGSNNKPSASQVKSYVFSRDVPACYDYDVNFEVLSIEEKKVAQFKLPLVIDPFKSENVIYQVISVDNEGKKKLDGVFDVIGPAIQRMNDLN